MRYHTLSNVLKRAPDYRFVLLIRHQVYAKGRALLIGDYLQIRCLPAKAALQRLDSYCLFLYPVTTRLAYAHIPSTN